MRIRKPLFVNLSVLGGPRKFIEGFAIIHSIIKKNVLEVKIMDLRALNEIERVVRQAKARFRQIPLMCIDCNH